MGSCLLQEPNLHTMPIYFTRSMERNPEQSHKQKKAINHSTNNKGPKQQQPDEQSSSDQSPKAASSIASHSYALMLEDHHSPVCLTCLLQEVFSVNSMCRLQKANEYRVSYSFALYATVMWLLSQKRR